MRFALVALLLVGCRQIFGIHEVVLDRGDAAPIDMSIDAPPDAPAGVTCYGAPWRVCFDQPLTSPVTLDTQTIDTASSTLCMAHTASAEVGDACVIAGTTVTLTGTIVVTGARPIVLVASDTLTFGGAFDVSSRTGTQVGAGAATCAAGNLPTTSNTSGGGAGGSFGGGGGKGGNGTVGGMGGRAAGTLAATSLRGGCSGQDGAGVNGHGVGGAGGGALLAIADTTHVDGTIDASGGAGTGAQANTGGGGGGGSGGLIALEASTIVYAGNVWANGGGGGEASGGGTTGNDGAESTGPTLAGAGGSGSGSNSGDGGDGSQGPVLGGGDGKDGVGGSQASGGGGGGGAGVLLVHVVTVQGGGSNLAPPPT